MCKENGTYVGGLGFGYSTLSHAIADGAFCNSGQSCCHFLYDGEYRSDYDVDSTLGVCSNYNPDRPTEHQIGENTYGSLEAFNNAIIDGIMCNCFSAKPIINFTNNFGQMEKVMYSPFEWPSPTVKNDKKKEHTFISGHIEQHPPNLYVTLSMCGYPSRITAFRAPTFQILESQSDGMKNNTYQNLYGTTPAEIRDNNIQQLTIPNNSTTNAINSDGKVTDKGNKLDNTQEFNEGLKAGKNIIIIECANGKEMVYTVCVPHQTVPDEKNMWRTSFFNCEGNAPPKLPSNTWYCTHEINMATNLPSPCCIPVPSDGVPTSNFQTFATQKDCQNQTQCCNETSQGMASCCGGVEQGDPCTYNSWNNYFTAQNRIDYCNNHCLPGQPYWNGGAFSLPYCPCCPPVQDLPIPAGTTML